MEENNFEDKKKIEAVLFTTGRFMEVQEIADASEIGSVGYVSELLKNLIEDYKIKDGALHIIEHEGKFKLNIRKEYGMLANKLVSTSEFDNSTTKTLAIIAYKNPAMQSDIIKARGNKAYDHIKTLKESGLVTSDKSGRTRLLKLTPKFYDYFDTANEAIKETFSSTEENTKKRIAEKAGMTLDEVDEKEKLLEELEKKEREMKAKIKEENKPKAVEEGSEEKI